MLTKLNLNKFFLKEKRTQVGKLVICYLCESKAHNLKFPESLWVLRETAMPVVIKVFRAGIFKNLR